MWRNAIPLSYTSLSLSICQDKGGEVVWGGQVPLPEEEEKGERVHCHLKAVDV